VLRSFFSLALISLVAALGLGCRELTLRAQLRAAALVKSGHYVAAERELRRWLALVPRDTALRALEIKLLCDERRIADAVASYQRYHGAARVHSRPLLVAILRGAIDNGDDRVAAQAIRACGEFDLVETHRDVLKAMHSRRAWLRAEAYEAIGRSSYEDAAFALFYGFWDDDEYVRAHALQAAGRLGDSRSLWWSRLCCQDPDPIVQWREAITRTLLGDLSELRWIKQGLIEGDIYAVDAAACLVEIGRREYLPVVARCLTSDEPMARYRAARNLGELKAHEYLSDIVALSRDTCDQVREGVADGLGRMGDTAALVTLVELARDRNYETRATAAISIAQLRLPDTESRLIRLLSDTCNVVRVSAVGSLAGLQPAPAAEPDTLPESRTESDTSGCQPRLGRDSD
jgi:HEAT repeat protein